MKHELRVVGILLIMFLLTQLIGLVVIDAYSPSKVIEIEKNGEIINKTVGGNATIPYGMEPPEIEPGLPSLGQFIIALVFAIIVYIILMKIRARSLLKMWFTIVVFLTLSISLTAVLGKIFPSSGIRLDAVALILAIPLTFYKVFKRDILVHNTTELLIYPGLAAVFVPILNIWTTLVLLLLISIYDIYAVWKSKIMIKMVKYDIQNLKIFPGFLVPYLPGKEALKLKAAQKIKTQKSKIAKLKKIKISTAMLGGGDVAFPLIFAGVIYRIGGLIPALIIIAGSTLALLCLFAFTKKGKMYPAMPFISAGCLVGYLATLLI